MYRIIFYSILLAFSGVANAQMHLDSYDTLTKSQEISIQGVVDYSASSLQNQLTNKFIFGGEISTAIKDLSNEKHKAINRAGIDAGGEISYSNYDINLFKNKDWGIRINAGYHNFGGVLYSKDLFGLAFYGNEPFLGDTLSMSGTDVSFTSFQKVGFGFIAPKTRSSASINFYNISNRINGDFRGLEIIQTADGNSVDLAMDGEVELPQNNKFSQGVGVGFDLDFKISVAWYKERTARIQFLAKNVGFGYMHEAQKKYSFDTSFVYSGLRFDQIIGDNSLLGDSTASLLDTVGITAGTSNPFFVLPGFFQVGKMVDLNSEYKLQSFFGARVYPTLIYSPFVFAGVDYRAVEWLNVGASLAYGGFAGLKGGIYANMNWDKIQMGLGTDNLTGIVSGKGNGSSMYLRLACRL
jgi:hypothetical protein